MSDNPGVPFRPPFLALLLLVLLAAPADAGEAAAPDARHDAQAVGRALLAQDAATRADAIKKLEHDIAAGRATKAYLEALADAAAAWADDSARLADVWIERAVEGDARERRVAVRLLHALGPDAVERLALELRHQRHRPEQAAATQRAEVVTELAPTTPAVPEVQDNRIAKIYLVRGLQRSGMNRLQIRGFLEKHANASNVKGYGDRYTVLADADGHKKLAQALARYDTSQANVRRAQPVPPKDGTTRDAAPVPPADEVPANDDAAPKPVPVPNDEPPAGPAPEIAKVEPKAGSETPALAAPASKLRWRIKPVVVQVPRAEGYGLLYGQKKGDDATVITYVDDLGQAKKWAETARTLPDARELGQWDALMVVGHRAGKITAGKKYHYNKAIRKSKTGAYDIVSGALHHGYNFAFTLRERGLTTQLSIKTTRDSISMPVPSREVRPTKDAVPIKIESPQWSRASTTTNVVLKKIPAAVLVVLLGIDEQKPNDDIVLIVTIEDRRTSYKRPG